MRSILLIALLMLTLNSKLGADQDDSTHFAAHFGASYAINTFSYLLVDRIGLAGTGCLGDYPTSSPAYCGRLREEYRTKSLIFSTFITLVVGFTYKYVEAMNCPVSQSDSACWSQIGGTRAMLQNVAGTAASDFTILLFKF